MNNAWVVVANAPKMIKAIALDLNSDPWIVTMNREVYLFKNNEAIKHSEDATDIAVGGDGSVWYLDSYGFEQKVKPKQQIYLDNT